jgi:hypothetical protein
MERDFFDAPSPPFPQKFPNKENGDFALDGKVYS